MPPSIAQARKGLAVYLVLVIAGSAVLQVMLLRGGDSIANHRGLILALMWMPGLASILTRVLLNEGFADISFSFQSRTCFQAVVLALQYPVLLGMIAYGMAWAFDLVAFEPPPLDQLGVQTDKPTARFIILLAHSLTVQMIVGMVFAAGEEIGWRGYMLWRLIDAGLPRPVFLSGLIWALWHVPLIVSGQYASSAYPVLSACIFVVNIMVAGYIVAWLRLNSGSIWPAIVFHAAWNAVIQGVFDVCTKPAGSLWVGESGLLVTIVNLLLVVLFVRQPWKLRRTPMDQRWLEVGVKGL
jgi:membrane protease YdiL (CAAX protease family)